MSNTGPMLVRGQLINDLKQVIEDYKQELNKNKIYAYYAYDFQKFDHFMTDIETTSNEDLVNRTKQVEIATKYAIQMMLNMEGEYIW